MQLGHTKMLWSWARIIEGMRQRLRGLICQPIVAIVFCLVALTLLVSAWWNTWYSPTSPAGIQTEVLACFLIGAFVIASLHPIHIGYRTKITIATVPLYLMIMLLPSPIAGVAVAIGSLSEQLVARRNRGTWPSDIVTAVSRMTILALIGTWIATVLFLNHLDTPLALFAIAAIVYSCDILLTTLEIGTMSEESLGQILVGLVQGGYKVEPVLYLLGMVGTLLAIAHVWALTLLVPPVMFVALAFRRSKEMHSSTRRLLESIADTVDLRDPYTGGHSRRVAEFCEGIMRAWPMHGQEAELTIAAARVHDIGKIAIPDQILNKAGRLEPEERAIMQSHSARGADFLARYPDFTRGVEIVRHHHENWNGNGYPDGLSDTAIPFGARVIAVADSFDAMTSDRPYRKGMSVAQATQILRNGRGEQWDAAIVDAFLRSIDDRFDLVEWTTLGRGPRRSEDTDNQGVT
jgi:HD-GYP domain-containing protein (c-di-GMP phosphodiesterase class II)